MELVWTPCDIAIILGEGDFSEIGRGDSQNGIGDGAYLGDVGIGSGGGDGE